METPSRHSYNLDGTLRVFPVASPIKGDNYCRLEVDGTIINDRTQYDIVNNSIVFKDTTLLPDGSQLDILVVQSEEAIGQLTITTNIDIVAQDIDNVNIVGDDIANVNTTATNIANVNTVANDLNEPVSEIDTVAGSIANVNIVGSDIANVNTVAGSITDVNTVAANIADVNRVEDSINNIDRVNTSIAKVDRVYTSIDNVDRVYTSINNIDRVDQSITNIDRVYTSIDNIDTVENSIANVDTTASSIANVNTVGAAIASVNTTATNIADVVSVADNMAEVLLADTNAATATTQAGIATTQAVIATTQAGIATTKALEVANAQSDAEALLVQFTGVYHGASATAPTTGLDAGDLYFDTALNEMRVYDGSAWAAAGSTVNGTTKRQTYTATAGQTAFTVTGGYDAGFADVYLNGVKLVNGVDVDVSSGTGFTLTTGATVGDNVDFIGYGAFEVADTYTQAETDSLLATKVNTSAIGTAAASDVTTSTIDTTAGRLLKVRDFGVGVDYDAPRLTNLNQLLPNGVYTVSGSATGRPGRVGNSSHSMTVSRGGVAGIVFQTVIHGSGIYVRVYYNGSWGDWIDFYHTGNIVGTVSQSGGVPTGAIIERGSNANGDYTKYADGTLICRLTPFTFSGWASSGTSNTKTLPHSSVFAGNATASFASASTIPSENRYPVFTTWHAGSDAVALRATVTPGNQLIFVIFIGRWY